MGIDFTFVRMVTKAHPGNHEGHAAANWRDLRLSLNWCYKGRPLRKKLTTTGVYLVIWHLLDGGATLQSGNETTQAGKGQWLVTRPSRRTHEFTDSARILSIHIAVECLAIDACWRGPAAIVLPDDDLLRRLAARLRRATALKNLQPDNQRNLIDLPTSIDEALELREAVAAFARRLFALAADQGLAFGPPEIRDERVRLSRLYLAETGFREKWSRSALARAHGLSPSQLDRLWRRELEVTPHRYWEQRKLEEACFRLQHGSAPIKEIAYDLGFTHLSRFTIWFRTLKGQSPRSFRSRGFSE